MSAEADLPLIDLIRKRGGAGDSPKASPPGDGVFGAIDAKLVEYRRSLAATKEAVSALGGAYVRLDEHGYWRCSYRQTTGLRLRVSLAARSYEGLIALLSAAPDRPGRVERRNMDATAGEG